ncbi:phytanoyl-CoA dioxygenase [Mycolicibacterium sp. 018/SC-01/001]|uniref:phytanoyl-CoA dioxygenase family protein n=1 Tax=Mycolicibacterium sp. 018/SC-01/001 TaxID=2592069 RepID=UPI00117E1B0B|nr:phytanoyl-CoA dioxygenase family protein [Mycolicibacterium sp. 018/SC-01/001]TRW88425.1 phytanoyl-CoA dioxygenase [Mycolicibacterium sp. 018/SC-01/001]
MATSLHPAAWLGEADCDLDEFRTQVEQQTDPADYPHAADLRSNVLVYSAAAPADRRALQAELIRALTDGPGVVVFAGAFTADVVARTNDAFFAIVEQERQGGRTAGDHFGAPGANDRVWNAAQKLALRDPQAYAEYYANDTLALVCQAWLGPRYQLTSQVNIVNPGGAAQVPHRDYHLGFVPAEHLAQYPAHLHRMSPALTLQGAVAHCDMPVDSGPTMLLPFSQRFAGGYLAFNRPEFIDYFAQHRVQVPLTAGDAVFFNPALYHGAGANMSSDIRRIANLLQVSSPFGRAMEAVDRAAMTRAVYPVLRRMRATGRPEHELRNVVIATAEGYAFPTNLDSDPPVDSLAPRSQVDIVLDALGEDLTEEQLDTVLTDYHDRRMP